MALTENVTSDISKKDFFKKMSPLAVSMKNMSTHLCSLFLKEYVRRSCSIKSI